MAIFAKYVITCQISYYFYHFLKLNKLILIIKTGMIIEFCSVYKVSYFLFILLDSFSQIKLIKISPSLFHFKTCLLLDDPGKIK